MPRPTPIIVPAPNLGSLQKDEKSTGVAALEGLSKILSSYQEGEKIKSSAQALKALIGENIPGVSEENLNAVVQNPALMQNMVAIAKEEKGKKDLQSSLENYYDIKGMKSDEVKSSLKALGLLGQTGEKELAQNVSKVFTEYLSDEEKKYFGIPVELKVSKKDFKDYIPQQSSDAWKIVADKNSSTGFSHMNVSTGKVVPNAVAPSSGTTVNVNTGKHFLESVGGKLGEDVMTTKQAAVEATNTITAAHQIKSAVDSGNIILGPGATLRTKGAQVAQMMGFTGDNAVENTRNAIQGLAKLTLGQRQLLKGQGQISDKETALLEKAVSGNISDLTIPEIKIIADIAERGARLAIKRNKANQEKLSKNPDSKSIVDFLTVDEPPPYKSSQSGNVQKQQSKTKYSDLKDDEILKMLGR